MSEVFQAVREADQRELALKVLDTGNDDDVALLHRFIQEYALLAQINHPNVAKIYDQGITDSHAFLSMEYFAGGDIRRRIAVGMAQNQALGVTVQVALALVQIHALGIVHRDVKPDNLMLRQDGSVALIDFGIAKHADHALGHTLHWEIVGSPYYLSPEQAAGRAVSAASDIYCLGVIFFEMLTGVRPYAADRVEVLLAQHLFSPTPTLAAPHRAMQGLLDQMMHKDPALRMIRNTAAW
ncbi:MAG: serine/threonine protein kinase [Rhodoferax sp.]|nr:serine/threonine protein kinase [Rhodoferax sp.]